MTSVGTSETRSIIELLLCKKKYIVKKAAMNKRSMITCNNLTMRTVSPDFMKSVLAVLKMEFAGIIQGFYLDSKIITLYLQIFNVPVMFCCS